MAVVRPPSFQDLSGFPLEIMEMISLSLDGRSLIALSLCNSKTSDELSQLVNSNRKLCGIWIQYIVSRAEGSHRAKMMIAFSNRKVETMPVLAYLAFDQAQQEEALSRTTLFLILESLCAAAEQQLSKITTAKFSYHNACMAFNLLEGIMPGLRSSEETKVNSAISRLIDIFCRLAEGEVYWRANHIPLLECLGLVVKLIEKSPYQRPKEFNALIEKAIPCVFRMLKHSSYDLDQHKHILQIALSLIDRLRSTASNPAKTAKDQVSLRKRLTSSIYPEAQEALLLPRRAHGMLELAITTANNLKIQGYDILRPLVDLAFRVSSKSKTPLAAFRSLVQMLHQPLDALVQLQSRTLTAERLPVLSEAYSSLEEMAQREDLDDQMRELIAQSCCRIAKREVVGSPSDAQNFFLLALKLAEQSHGAALKIPVLYKVCKITSDVDPDFARQLWESFKQKKETLDQQVGEEEAIRLRCKLAMLEARFNLSTADSQIEELLNLDCKEAYHAACKIVQVHARKGIGTLQPAVVFRNIKQRARQLQDGIVKGYAFSFITKTLCEMAVEQALMQHGSLAHELCQTAFAQARQNPPHLFWETRFTPFTQCYSLRRDLLQIFFTCKKVWKTTHLKKTFLLANTVRTFDQNLQRDISFKFRELFLQVKLNKHDENPQLTEKK